MAFQALSVIVPVVSETQSLIETVETIIKTCDKTDLKEIIICLAHFASSESKRIAHELCEKYKDIPVSIVLQDGTFEDAIKEILQVVAGSHYIFQPADLEEDPAMLADFINEAKKNPRAVITGSRFLIKGHAKNCALSKRIIFFFFRRFFNILYSVKLTDPTFLYQMVPSKAAKALFLREKSYSIMYEIFYKLIRIDTKIQEVPVEFNSRPDGKSEVRLFKDGWRIFWVFFWVRFYNTP